MLTISRYAAQAAKLFPLRLFSSSSEEIRMNNIRSGRWAEKESLECYLKDRIPNLQQYFKMIEGSSEEDQKAARIMRRYLNKEAYNYQESLPYHLDLRVSHPGDFSEEELAFYLENGFVGPTQIPSVSKERLKALHDKFSGMLKGATPEQNRSNILRQEWRDLDVFDIVTNKEIVSRISSILGPNIKMRYTSMHEVPPGEGSFSEMTKGHIPDFYAHSDMNLGTAVIPTADTEKPFCDRDAVSAWISISGTTPQNAPLFVFPKTHQWEITTPLTYMEQTKHDREALANTCRLLSTKGWANNLNAQHYLYYQYLLKSPYQKMLSTAKRTELYMAAGECLFFTTHLLHGSLVNQLPIPRLGMSIRYSRAANPENVENLTVVRQLFSESERERLGLKEGDDRIPIFQVLGTEHHENTVPVNLVELRKILAQRRSNA